MSLKRCGRSKPPAGSSSGPTPNTSSTLWKKVGRAAGKSAAGLEKGWAKGWKRRGWKKSDGSPALNPDLWQTLLSLCDTHDVHCHWVKGHAENEYNNRCDQQAVLESQKFK